MDPDPVATARRALLDTFRWSRGHADMWNAFEDGPTFASIVSGLAHLAASDSPAKIMGIESRGFLLGGAVAAHLGLGFHAIRKTDGLLVGEKISVRSAPDYRGLSHDMRTRATLGPHDRVVLADDWIELGSQAAAARELVTTAGAQWLGVVAMVDDRGESAAKVGPVASLVRSSELGPSDT